MSKRGKFPRVSKMPIVAKISAARKPVGHRLRELAFFPTLLTIGNLICGFAAIHFASRAMYEFGMGSLPEQVAGSARTGILASSAMERLLPSFLSVGAGLVILGMIFDCFDGLVARVTRSTTNFGGQLDSLADVVTSGVAPATLTIAFMSHQLAGDSILPSPISEHFLGRVTWVAAAVFVAFTAIRLARYNVEHAKADFDPHVFRGLPTPGAGFLLVSLILLQDQVGETSRYVIACLMPLAALTAGFLMVSRIRYRRFYRSYLLGRQPFGRLVYFVALFSVFWSYKAPTLAVLGIWYVASGPVFHFQRRWRDWRRPPETPEQSQDDETRLRA